MGVAKSIQVVSVRTIPSTKIWTVGVALGFSIAASKTSRFGAVRCLYLELRSGEWDVVCNGYRYTNDTEQAIVIEGCCQVSTLSLPNNCFSIDEKSSGPWVLLSLCFKTHENSRESVMISKTTSMVPCWSQLLVLQLNLLWLIIQANQKSFPNSWPLAAPKSRIGSDHNQSYDQKHHCDFTILEKSRFTFRLSNKSVSQPSTDD